MAQPVKIDDDQDVLHVLAQVEWSDVVDSQNLKGTGRLVEIRDRALVLQVLGLHHLADGAVENAIANVLVHSLLLVAEAHAAECARDSKMATEGIIVVETEEVLAKRALWDD